MVRLQTATCSIYVLFYLGSYLVPMSSSCNIQGIENCPHSTLIQQTDTFCAFIPPDVFDLHCRWWKDSLDCARSDMFMEGCDFSRRSGFDSQAEVQKAVCQDYSSAYMKSSDCLFQDGVKESVTICLRHAFLDPSSADICRTITEVRQCTRYKVLDAAGCQRSDSSLMGKLVDKFLQGLVRESSCTLMDIDDEPIPTEPAVDIVTTTDPPSTPTPTTTTTPRSTATTTITATTTYTTKTTTASAERLTNGRNAAGGKVSLATAISVLTSVIHFSRFLSSSTTLI